MTNGVHVRIFGGAPPMPPADADFSFTIDFAKGQGDPRRVFDAASELIDGFEELDSAIVGSIDTKTKTLMVLEDVEAGSMRVWLTTILENIDDQALRAVDRRQRGSMLTQSANRS